MDTNLTQTLQKLLIDTLTELKSGTEKTVNFALDQAPDVAQQLVTYTFWKSCAVAAIAIAITLIFVWLLILVWKDGNKSEDKDPHFVVGIFLVGFAVVSITVSIIYIDDALKAKLAPKVFIIEYTAKLIKDAK